MTPEVPISPSVQAIRGLSGISSSVAETSRLEFKSKLPEVKMLLGEESEENKNGEKEYRARQYFQEGASSLEVLRTSTHKEQLIDAERTFMAGFEDMSLHRDGTFSEYRLDDAISVVADRAAAMSYDFKTLSGLGYLDPESFNPDTGEANFSFPGYCYTTKTRMIETQTGASVAPDGKTVISINIERVPTQVFLVGKDEERNELSGVLKSDAQPEMTARKDLVQMTRWLWNQTENLEDLVKYYYMGSSTHTAMNALCNAEGRKYLVKESTSTQERPKDGLFATEGGAEYREGHEFGDAMSVAIQCFEIAAFSEKKSELKSLLQRPGVRLLFKVTDQEVDDIFLKPEDRKDRPLNPILVKWIGEPWNWSEEIAGPKDNVGNEQDSRGLLTKHGNILVESKWEDAEDIFQQVERFLGGGKDSSLLVRSDARDARFIAWELFRVTGMASELGGQLYHHTCVDGIERDVISHDLGGMTSCDRVKVYLPNVFRSVYKNIKPEVRNFGPDGSLGQYPDRLTVAYFKQWTADIKYEEGKEECSWIKDKQSHGKRTFQEMRWGYRAGKEKDTLTGKEIDMPEEAAYRLGELPWHKLHPKVFNVAALGPYIAGRENVGLFTYIKKTNWDIHELKDDGFAKSMANWLGIAMNEQTVYDGKLRGVYDGTKPSTPSEESHDKKVKAKVKSEIREYKKKFVRAWWDGLRSLPQWREWLMESERLDSPNVITVAQPLERIKFRLGRVEILTPGEAKNLPMDPFNKNTPEWNENRQKF